MSDAADSATRYCVNHPDRETLVACGRCGKPFCPDCLIYTPAGQRCYECAGVRRNAAQMATARRVLGAAGVVVLGAAIGGLFGNLLYLLLAALVTGGVAGQYVSPSVNRKTRRRVYALSLAALLLGALAGWVAIGLFRFPPVPLSIADKLFILVPAVFGSLYYWLFVVVAGIVGYQRLR